MLADAPLTITEPDRQRVPGSVGDVRTTAVLAVLAGVGADTVAGQLGIPPSVLSRWVETFVDAGRAAVGDGTCPTRTGTDPRDRDRYLSLVAHELRSPLTMIQGWVDVLRQPEGTEEFRQHALSSVDAQVTRLRRLADDALDATSMALGHLELHTDRRSLGGVVSQIAAVRSISPPEVEVVCDSMVDLDYTRFGQILDNLLDNAMKHGAGLPSIRVDRRGTYAEVVVTSLGSPIAPDLAAMMFEPFERGAANVEGVGLGLYVCRSLTEAHGGQIGLRVDDDGNHFWIRLPIVGTQIDVRTPPMSYEIACGDVMPGCTATFEAPSRAELMARIAAHAAERHGIVAMTPDIAHAIEQQVQTS